MNGENMQIEVTDYLKYDKANLEVRNITNKDNSISVA